MWIDGKIMKKSKLLLGFFFISFFAWNILALASDTHCEVCHMLIPQNARSHVVLATGKSHEDPHLHVCSVSCVAKAKKNGFKYTRVEIIDFNHPEKFLDGHKAFFIVNSKKIKADMGDMAMPPYFAAFATKKEAEAAQKKYGDGALAQGFEEALKTVKLN